MKKIFPILAILMIALSSCSSDYEGGNNNTENATELILGTWRLVSSTENGTSLSQDECDLQETYSWDSSGNFTEILYDNNTEPCGSPFENNGSYTISGTDVTFTLGNDTFTQQIQNINENQLVLREIYTDNGTTIEFIDTYQKN
jgi:hypothetical protein